MNKKTISIIVCIILFLILAPSNIFIENVKANLATGLVGYWSFNDGTAIDSSGNNHHGIIYGSPQSITGIVGSGFNLDGIDDYIKVNHHNDFNFGTGDFSIVFWFNQETQGDTPNDYRQLLCKRIPGSDNNFNLECQIQNDRLEIPIGDTSGFVELIYENVQLYTWYFVCVVRDSGICNLYINNILEDSKTSSHDLSFTRDLFIGNDDYKYENWAGIIDEVRIYNRKLETSEIQTLYNQEGNQPPSEPKITSGQEYGQTVDEYNFSANCSNPDDNQIWYMWDWDDGTTSDWLGPYNSDDIVEASHSWEIEGSYNVKVKAKNNFDLVSNWSKPYIVNIEWRIEFLIGLISDINEFDNMKQFNCILVPSISFSPLRFHNYRADSMLTVLNEYQGILNSFFILGNFKISSIS